MSLRNSRWTLSLQRANAPAQRGLKLLIKASRHSADRVRVNAITGLARLTDQKKHVSRVVKRLEEMMETDRIPDIRSVAKLAIHTILERFPEELAADPLPKTHPRFRE